MSGHERIFLQPRCCVDPSIGQMWCEDDQTDLEKCSEPWTEYIRADIAAAQVAAARLAALLDAADAVEGTPYLLSIGEPGTGPFTRMDQVCKETRKQAAKSIRALMQPDPKGDRKMTRQGEYGQTPPGLVTLPDEPRLIWMGYDKTPSGGRVMCWGIKQTEGHAIRICIIGGTEQALNISTAETDVQEGEA